jgi:hypothetical protein
VVPAALAGHWLRGKAIASNAVGTGSQFSAAWRVGGDVVYDTFAFNSSTPPLRSGIAVMSSVGGAARQLTPLNPGWNAREPALSPDGTMVVFGSQEGATTGACGGTTPYKLWIMRSDGTNRTKIDPFAAASSHTVVRPRFSPDGQKVAWVDTCTGTSTNQGTVQVMNVDGTGASTVYTQTTPSGSSGTIGPLNGVEWVSNSVLLVSGSAPTNAVFWAQVGCISGGNPNYQQIVGFSPGCGDQWYSRELFTIPVGGGSPTLWTTTSLLFSGVGAPGIQFCDCHTFTATSYSSATNAAVTTSSPSSGNINFSSYPAQLFTRSAGGTLSPIPGTANHGNPSLSPDGLRVVAQTSLAQVVAMNVDGTAVTSLQPGASPFWGFASEPLPPLPLGQTFGFELGENPGSDGDVNASTGSFSYSVVDAKMPGVDRPFVFARSYNSADSSTGGFGPGWHHPFEAKLTIAGNGDVTVMTCSPAVLTG